MFSFILIRRLIKKSHLKKTLQYKLINDMYCILCFILGIIRAIFTVTVHLNLDANFSSKILYMYLFHKVIFKKRIAYPGC